MPAIAAPGRCDVRYCTTQENRKRGNWTLNVQSILALISVVFSGGMVERVPYLFFVHGDAYFVAYSFLLFVVGIPFVYYELSMGQFSSNGILTCWPLPIFKFIGAGILCYNLPLAAIYNIFGAWSMFYLHVTTQVSINNVTLPWQSRDAVIQSDPDCANSSLWVSTKHLDVTPDCSQLLLDIPESNWTAQDGICWCDFVKPRFKYYLNTSDERAPGRYAVAFYDEQKAIDAYVSDPDGPNRHIVMASESPGKVYFECHVLRVRKTPGSSQGMFDIGTIACYICAWVLVMFVTMWPVRILGIVLALTVSTSIAIFLLLFDKAVRLPGSDIGSLYGFRGGGLDDEESFIRAFHDAAQQVILSLFLGHGILTTYGSYNRFHNNYVRDIFIFGIFSFLCNLFVGIMVLSFVGYYCNLMGLQISDVMQSGPSLTFSMMPTILATLPDAYLWCGLFYMLMIFINFHTVIGLMETLVTAVQDQVPRFRKFRPFFVAGVCAVFALLGLPMCTASFLRFVTVDILVYQRSVVIVQMVACYVIYGLMTCCWYRHDVAPMMNRICCCVKPIVCWVYCTFSAIVLTSVASWQLLRYQLMKIGNMAASLSDPISEWTNRQFESVVRIYTLVVIMVVLVTQIVRSVVWKKPPTRELFTKKWRPALRQHENMVRMRRGQTPLSTTEDYCDTRPDPEAVLTAATVEVVGENGDVEPEVIPLQHTTQILPGQSDGSDESDGINRVN